MKYKLACGLLSVCMLFSLTSCGGQPSSTGSVNADEIERINTEETYPSIPATLAVTYHDVESIIDDADIVIKGTVTEQDEVLLDGFPQTHTMMDVASVLKGDVQVGDSIEVIEEGGFDGRLVCGIPQLSTDYDYYLMLLEYEGAYYVCGAFQGRFVERDGHVFQQATEDVKLTRAYSPLSSEEFESMVLEYVEASE